MDVAAMFAGIAQGISAAFGGPYFPGRVIDQTSATYDAGGSIIPGEARSRTCQVQVDSVTEAMRQAEGYADRDMRVLVLAATLEGGMDSDARIEVLAGPHAGIWLVSNIQRDPLGVYWAGRGRAA